MRIPIAYGLAYPRRIKTGVQNLNLAENGNLEFREADEDQFPCLRLGRMALREAGATPIVLNAANEVAVDAFLKGSISLPKIPEIIEEVIMKIPCESPSTLAIIQDIDIRAKELANRLILMGC
jgi:1-deoxy-D-xylulose-5-phosphate reductoisomerase